MPIIALLCPHCSGQIELDDTREFGFCQYCGTKIMIEQQKQQVGDYQTNKSTRLKEQVRKQLSEGNYQGATSVLDELRKMDDKDPDFLLLDIECLYKRLHKSKQLIPSVIGRDSYWDIAKDYQSYKNFSNDTRTLSEIIQSFNLPPYDLQGNMNINGRVSAMHAGRVHLDKVTSEETIYDYDVNFLKEIYLKKEKGVLKKPFLINVFKLIGLDILDPSAKVFDYYSEFVPVVAALMDYVTIEKITEYGCKIQITIKPCPFVDEKNEDLIITPETISQYYNSIEKPSFFKGLIKKVPDEERNREYMQKYDRRVEGLKQFYTNQFNDCYKKEYAKIVFVVHDYKWISSISAPFNENPPVFSFEDTFKVKEEHQKYLDSLKC